MRLLALLYHLFELELNIKKILNDLYFKLSLRQTDLSFFRHMAIHECFLEFVVKISN